MLLAFVNSHAYACKLGDSVKKCLKDAEKDIRAVGIAIDNGPIGDVGRGVEHFGKEVTGVNADNRTKEARREREAAEARNALLIKKSNLDAQLATIDVEIQSISTSIVEKTNQKGQLEKNKKQLESALTDDSTIEKHEDLFKSFEKVKQKVQEYGDNNTKKLEGKSPMEMWGEIVESYGQQLVESDFSEKNELDSILRTLYGQLVQLQKSQAELNGYINGIMGSKDFEEMEKRLFGLFYSLKEIQNVQNGQISDLSSSISEMEQHLKSKNELKGNIQTQVNEVKKSLGIQ